MRACACVSATATAAPDPRDLYECKRRTALRNKSRKGLNDHIYSRNLLAPAMRYEGMNVLHIRHQNTYVGALFQILFVIVVIVRVI